MKYLYSSVPVVAVLLAGMYSFSARPQDKTGKPVAEPKQEKPEKKSAETPPTVTMQGQVVDLACYLTNGGALAGEHQQCAEMCVSKGSTAGFKTADRSYLIIRDPMHQKDAPELSQFVNKNAEITAQVFTRDGMQAIKVLTIK